MPERRFDNEIPDAQGTIVEPIEPAKFDIARYVDYEAGLLERNREFWASDSGVAVHRRFRVPQVFSGGCKDMERSLAVQLGALTESMKYEADIANFLEPWYGIAAVASAFGVDYQWPEGQAPALKPPFRSVAEALEREIVPVEQTRIGKHTLEMIEYFLDKTGGRIAMSLTDTQSAMNTASFIVETNNFLMSFYDDPEGLKKLLGIINQLLIDFTKKQMELIGDALAKPGHGFASSREFSGFGMSDDIMTMLSAEQYREFETALMARAGEDFGGSAFHSCGDFSAKIAAVGEIANLVMIDGAFSAETDPDPNPAEPFVENLVGSGIVLNARIVGGADVVVDAVRQLWRPGMKLIAVTYCNEKDQQQVYEQIHQMVDGSCS